jgi:hypothetical protein
MQENSLVCHPSMVWHRLLRYEDLVCDLYIFSGMNRRGEESSLHSLVSVLVISHNPTEIPMYFQPPWIFRIRQKYLPVQEFFFRIQILVFLCVQYCMWFNTNWSFGQVNSMLSLMLFSQPWKRTHTNLLKCLAQNFQKYPNADRPQDRPQKIVLQPRNLTQLKCTMYNNRSTVLPCCTPSDGAAYLSCFQTPCEICGVAHSFHCQVVDHGSTSDWSSSSKCKLLSCAIHTVIAHPCILYQIALEFNGYGQQGIISFKMWKSEMRSGDGLPCY